MPVYAVFELVLELHRCGALLHKSVCAACLLWSGGCLRFWFLFRAFCSCATAAALPYPGAGVDCSAGKKTLKRSNKVTASNFLCFVCGNDDTSTVELNTEKAVLCGLKILTQPKTSRVFVLGTFPVFRECEVFDRATTV